MLNTGYLIYFQLPFAQKLVDKMIFNSVHHGFYF
jgi:hypothetical protein